MSAASGASSTPSTNCMKRSSITGETAGRRITNATSCAKRVNVAGASIIAGGTSTSDAGTTNAIGTSAITIATEFNPGQMQAPYIAKLARRGSPHPVPLTTCALSTLSGSVVIRNNGRTSREPSIETLQKQQADCC